MARGDQGRDQRNSIRSHQLPIAVYIEHAARFLQPIILVVLHDTHAVNPQV